MSTNFLFDIGVESGFEIPQKIFVTFENNNVNGQTKDAIIFKEMNVLNVFVRLVMYSILKIE